MGRSFFLGTDAELYTGSKSFSTKISAAPTDYGLTADQAAAYAVLDTTWQAAYLAATDPQMRTTAKVQAKNDAKVPLRIMASDLAKKVAGTATVTNEQKIDLGLSVRDTPSPVPSPGACSNFNVTLSGDGSLLLKWKCRNPARARGTIYQVWRRVGSAADFTYAGGTGQKNFRETMLPAGTTTVTYQVQAVRSTATGPWAQFNLNFGSAGMGGAASATVVEAPPPPGAPPSPETAPRMAA